MYGPLAVVAEGCGPADAGDEPFRVTEVTEWTVDGPQSVGAAGHQHAGEGRVPLVSRIVGVESPDGDRPGSTGGRIVRHSEMERLQPRARRRHRFDVGHAERGLHQSLHPYPVAESHRLLQLGEEGVDRVDVTGHAHLGNENRVEVGSGLLYHIDQIAVHVMGYELLPGRAGSCRPVPKSSFKVWFREFVVPNYACG